MSPFWVAQRVKRMLGGSKKASQIGTIGYNSAGSEMDTLLSFRRQNSRKLMDFSIDYWWCLAGIA